MHRMGRSAARMRRIHATLPPMDFDPISYINEPRWQKVSLGLHRTRRLMELLGHPERRLHAVHVAGTNGKGSTCAYLDAICRAAHLKTGLFTSPYIMRFEERIRVDGKDISSADLRTCTERVRDAARIVESEGGEHPTEFELMFAVAALHFARSECEACVIEVGLGGRLDATNVIAPDASVITRIGYDHTAILGDGIAQIAAEKAGIVKMGTPCITCEQEARAMKAIEDACISCESPLTVVCAEDIGGSCLTSALTRVFTYQGRGFETRLLGSYQPENASIAIEAARVLAKEGWPLSDGAICEGIASATWPGRFEVLAQEPLIIVDGAHNADGSRALAASMAELIEAVPVKRRFCVIGVLRDKDAARILEPHLEHADGFFVYAPDNPRALEADALAKMIEQMSPRAPVTCSPDAKAAMQAALNAAAPEDAVIAFGSLYSTSQIECAVDAHLNS